jgi:hypothetical protein
MSYDLYFDAGSGKKLDKKQFAAYFKSRPNYKVGNGQAVYENEDTAVHFIFDEPEDGMAPFNLNYFRPHVFGLEAAIELEAFVAAFGTAVVDPQADGSESGDAGPFDRENFLRAWNDGNQFAYRSLLKEQEEPVHTWPAKKIQEVWEWNYGRPPNEDRVTENMFVPGIFAVNVEGNPLSVVIWPPACPVLLPKVDLVLVPVAQTGEDSEEIALVTWDEIFPVVSPYQGQAGGLERYRLAFEGWPPEIAAFLAGRREPVGQLDGIGLDQILNREMVEEAT